MVVLLKGKEKCCSHVNRTFCPDTSAMPVDDALDSGKPNTGARIIGRAMEALESSEQLIGISHIESSAIIADEIGWFPSFILDANLDIGVLSLGCEFPGVAK